MSMFTKVNRFWDELQMVNLLWTDDRKIQQAANQMDDEDAEDLPQIDLNEMLADMTVEDSDKMDA